MKSQYIYTIAGGLVVSFVLWLTMRAVEVRWAESDIVLGWGCVSLLFLAILLHAWKGGWAKHTWADIFIIMWIVYYALRVWMGGEYACGTAFLKSMECAVLYVALRGIFSNISVSPYYIICGLLLCGMYEAIYGLWQLTHGMSRHYLYLLTGNFQNPGPYSAYLMMGAAIGLSWMQQMTNRKLKNIVMVATGIMLTLLPATWSRAALVSLGIIALWLYRKQYWRLRWVIWASVIVLGTGFYLVKQGSANGRALTWAASLTTWLHHSWLGVGVGGFHHACAEGIAELHATSPTSPLFESGGVTDYAFNDLLKILVEQGLIGMMLCISTVGIIMFRLHQRCKPLFYGMFSLLLFSMFSYPFELLPYKIIVILIAAWAVSPVLPNIERKISFGWATMLLIMLFPTFWLTKEVKQRYQADKEVSIFSGMHHEAFINDYYEILSFEMDNSQFLFDFGKTLRDAQRYNDSNATLWMGTRTSSDPMFLILMGNNYKDMGWCDKAEEAYKKAFGIMPNRMYPLYQLMLLYEHIGDEAKMRIMAQRVIDFKEKINSPATHEMRQCAKEKLTTERKHL